MRWVWFAAGWVAVALGGIGVVVPGLPTTVFFIIAAWCFGRSSPRFERWILNLPKVGPMVRDHRDGLGMPRKAKAWAIGSIVVFSGAGALFAGRPAVSAVIVALAAIGVWYVGFRVPTREQVLAATRESRPGRPAGSAATSDPL
ncbi:MAG: YbaN family protein [Acidimicrobiia bacterium]